MGLVASELSMYGIHAWRFSVLQHAAQGGFALDGLASEESLELSRGSPQPPSWAANHLSIMYAASRYIYSDSNLYDIINAEDFLFVPWDGRDGRSESDIQDIFDIVFRPISDRADLTYDTYRHKNPYKNMVWYRYIEKNRLSPESTRLDLLEALIDPNPSSWIHCAELISAFDPRHLGISYEEWEIELMATPPIERLTSTNLRRFQASDAYSVRVLERWIATGRIKDKHPTQEPGPCGEYACIRKYPPRCYNIKEGRGACLCEPEKYTYGRY